TPVRRTGRATVRAPPGRGRAHANGTRGRRPRMLSTRRKLGSRSWAITLTVLAAALAAGAPAAAFGQQAGAPARPAPDRRGHVEANGVRYYYEIHGAGEPLLLLHGGLGSID